MLTMQDGPNVTQAKFKIWTSLHKVMIKNVGCMGRAMKSSIKGKYKGDWQQITM